ncbi:hypothetical protein TNCT_473491 [Trichonephila clavata]|uniref:Uncharacterized protein n=1 Tax=Trichonephila clavata TaxID=2740835 RepID=A0A8X6LB69_TRICU|nr:hypothetical protein TNCT_473491 [Trichonephila clavata]
MRDNGVINSARSIDFNSQSPVFRGPLMALEMKESCGKLTEEGFVPPPGQEHVLFWRRATFCSVKERWNINVFQERGWSAEMGNSAVPFKKEQEPH